MSKKNSHTSESIAKKGRTETGSSGDDDVRDDISEQMNDKDDAADIALAAVDELADQAAEIEDLRKELDETKQQLLRQAAEFQNYRRRTEQEKSQLVELGKSVVIQQFLDVFDDFQRSLAAAEQAEQQEGARDAAYASLKEGVELVYKKFTDELAKHGVEPIEAVGTAFDENMHDAMLQQPSDEYAPGTVIQEIQRGYRMGDRVLRHAKVIVAA